MDIEQLREEVPIEEVLAHYGASIGRGGGWAKWIPITCPFCSDTNGSGSLNRTAGIFLCHQCGSPRNGQAGDIIDIVKDQEDLPTGKAIKFIEEHFL